MAADNRAVSLSAAPAAPDPMNTRSVYLDGPAAPAVSGGGQRQRNPVIAFYLPQFHPTPDNDKFWGPGFTEWHNVAAAYGLFEGHEQPVRPTELGYYDLRVPEVRELQAKLAREHGVDGFCYHHYWFNGRRVLERPFNEVLASGKPDFPFCLSWANENWTRRWDGGERDILIPQHYSDEDAAAHIRSLYLAFNDPRYIRLDGKPLFIVYNLGSIPSPRRFTDTVRETMRRDGAGDIHLCAAETFAGRIDPRPLGFDSAVEFPPHLSWRSGIQAAIAEVQFRVGFKGTLIDYRMMVHDSLNRERPAFPLFRTVVPGWDNTPRLKERALVLVNSSPDLFGEWLSHMRRWTAEAHPDRDAPVFINAWNEWAEGCHIEPDQQLGRARLLAVKRATAPSSLDTSLAAALAACGELSDGTRQRLKAELGDTLLARDKFWLRFMSYGKRGWSAFGLETAQDGVNKRNLIDQITMARYLYHWFGKDRGRLIGLRRALGALIKPILRRLSSERLD